MFDAELARQLGLVNRVVDDEDLDDEVARITSRIVALKSETVAANKQLINSRYEAAGVTDILRYEQA
jgi:enoyl-CoA hydratase/carnithine racemase